MELQATLSAVQAVSQKLNLYAIDTCVYDISIDRREVKFQGRYSPEWMRHLIVSKLDNFKQLPIMDNGFLEMTFTYNDVPFRIILT
jgi:hypothetical protein